MPRGEKGTLLFDPKIDKITRRNNNENKKMRLQTRLEPRHNQIAENSPFQSSNLHNLEEIMRNVQNIGDCSEITCSNIGQGAFQA